MPPEHGMSTGSTDAAVHRRSRRLFGIPSERKNPLNIQFERQVARLESRQQQQRCLVVRVIPFNLCYDFKSPSLAENGNNHPSCEPTSPEEGLEPSSLPLSSAPFVLFQLNDPDGSHGRWPDNSSRLLLEDKSAASNSVPDSDFLVSSFTKPSGNARHTARRKGKKKCKKHRQRCRKPVDGSEAKCRESNHAAAAAVDVGDCEDSTLSPKHVGDIHFEETYSPSSSVKEASEEAAGSVSSASSCDEIDLSRSTSCPGWCGQSNSSNFRFLDNTEKSTLIGSTQENCCVSNSANCDHAKALLIFRNECRANPYKVTEFLSTNSGLDENRLEKSDYSRGIHSQIGVDTSSGLHSVLCRDSSSDGDFQLVISRKRARKEKKMSLWRSYGERASAGTHDRNEKYFGRSSMQMTKEQSINDWPRVQNHVGRIVPHQGVALKHKYFMHKPSNVCTEIQNGVPAKDSTLRTRLNDFTNEKEITCGNSTKDYDKVQHVYLNRRKVFDAINSRESNTCEIRSISCSEPMTSRSLKGNCTSESGESTDRTVGALPMQKRRLQVSVGTSDASEIISGQSSPGSNSTPTGLVGTVPFVEGNRRSREFCDSRMHLVKMLRVVNDAYKVQVAADIHLTTGYPTTDLETFIYSATPVICDVPCMRSNRCSWDQVVSNSVCQHDISNVSLRSIWEWYEEPGCYGLEVKAHTDLSSKTSCSSNSEFSAYFVPYLSAVQLFGWSRNDMDNSFGVKGGELLKASNTASSLSSHPVRTKVHNPFEESNACLSESSFFVEDNGELMFEYFETDQPSFRPPLFEKVKELVSSTNVSDHRILGNPEKLQNTKLCDLHPASWFCVAWYPVYRVPRGNFRAAFLTYHSLGKLVPQKCSLDVTDGHDRIISPVVGLQSYNDKGEQWFQLRCPEDSLGTSLAEVLKERLRTLKMGALAMARAVIPKGTGESVNHHPDYEFFLSRCT